MLKAMAGKKVLLCLDHDAAAWKTLGALPGEYWPVPEGKDPGEYCQTGGDIRAWIEAGLEPDPPEACADDTPAVGAEQYHPPLSAYCRQDIELWERQREQQGVPAELEWTYGEKCR